MKLLALPEFMWRCCSLFGHLFLLLIHFTDVESKCILDKRDVTCFGSTWKEDLLPVDNNSLEKLYISNCAGSQSVPSEMVDLNFLRNMFKLTSLSMTSCSFVRPPHLDYQIPSVKVLDLSNNLIDTNAQFPVLGLDFFKQFPNLMVLNLTNNKLTHLPKNWFDCPSQLEIIILDGNQIAGLHPSLADCFVNLKHMSLRRNTFIRLRMPLDTRKVSRSDHIMDNGAMNLFSEQKTSIRRGSKKSERKGEKAARGRQDYLGVIPQFNSLETLDLSHNSIQSIDQIPLSNLKSLYKLNLSHNKLASNSVSNLNENECDFGTAPFYTNGKYGLIELDLSSNVGLTRIHNCWTFGLQNLRILRIENCSISSIYDSSFEKMKALTKLDLSFNCLSLVPKELMVVAKTLSSLNLSHNNLTQITSSSIIPLENLKILNLSHNHYTDLLSFPVVESENRLIDFSSDIRDSNSYEPINLLSKMSRLQEIDLSYNALSKVSAASGLSPSIRPNGELQKVDLRGNSFITQFTDFNFNEITTTLTDFLINEDLNIICDCLIVGFIKWIHQRQIEVSGKCAYPRHLSHLFLSNPQLITTIVTDSSCKEASSSISQKANYKLKLSSNANISLHSSPSDNDPMDNDQKKVSNSKRQVDQQKWIMTGMNLTMRCEFLSTHAIPMQVVIEWQRLQLKPFDSSHYRKQETPSISSAFLRNEKSERFDDVKYIEKIEHLSSNFDPRIKILQIGPVDEATIIDHFEVSEEWKNIYPKHKGSSYKYVGFLLLKPVFFTDAARYRCLVNDLPTEKLYRQNQIASKEENIKVFTPPRFTTTPSNPMAIIEGETAEITCRALGNPSPMTSLGRIGSKDFPAARGRRMTMYKDDSSFFITNVRQVDAGNYSCTSRNAAGIISYNFTLKVQMPANILNRIQPAKTVRLEEALIISFKIDGVPIPGVKWFKDGHRIFENDRIRFSADHLILIIQSTTLSDAGVYKISVLNALGGNDAFVSVRIVANQGQPNQGQPSHGPLLDAKEKSPSGNQEKEPSWMSDYWLSGIIIIVILSIVITSILWITIFFCLSKIIESKKRRLLLISNSQSRSSFDKGPHTTTQSTTTSLHTPRTIASSFFRPLGDCAIPLSMTTSTIAPHDQPSSDLYQPNIEVDTFVDSSKTLSDFYCPLSFQNSSHYSTNRFLSQPYLSTSGTDLSNKLSQSSSRNHDPCDSGIDSSQLYSETINRDDIRLPVGVYQCRHKSKHRSNHQKQRRRYECSASSDSIDPRGPVIRDGQIGLHVTPLITEGAVQISC